MTKKRWSLSQYPNVSPGDYLIILCFFDQNLPTTNARKPIECSKDVDFRLVTFERNSQEIDPLRCSSGPDTSSETLLSFPSSVIPKHSSNLKLPKSWKYKTSRIFRTVVFNQGFANLQGFTGRFPGVLGCQLSFHMLLLFNFLSCTRGECMPIGNSA